MKFNIAAIFVVASLANAAVLPEIEERNDTSSLVEPRSENCYIRTHFTESWKVGLHKRYRVEATAYEGEVVRHTEGDMLQKWCDIFYWQRDMSYIDLLNPQCHFNEEKNVWQADLTTEDLPSGYHKYKDLHQRTVNQWRHWSGGCDVDSKW